MIAWFWDETRGGSQEVHVPDWATFERIVRDIPPNPRDPALLTAIEVTNEEEGVTCIFIRTRHQGCTVAMSENDPDGKLSWPADVVDDGRNYVQYDYGGHFTEMPASVMISCETAMQAVRAFIETGSVPPSLIEFVPEY